jgi:hypothetical protein
MNHRHRKYSLYAKRDQLPGKVWQFVWNEDSPLYDGGCAERGGWSVCWTEKREEYSQMIKEVLSNPRILSRFVRVSIIDWGKQIIDFDTGHLDQLGENSSFAQIIPHHLDDENFYRSSSQYLRTLTFKTGSKVQRWMVGISVIAVIFFLYYRG